MTGVEPVMRFGDEIDDLRVHSKRLAGFAQRAAWPIGGDRRRNGRAIAPIFAVDVLDDFFAPLMLEVDVDVGRLAPLLRNETLEQHVAARRIDLGHAKAVTDRRVFRGAASLARCLWAST